LAKKTLEEQQKAVDLKAAHWYTERIYTDHRLILETASKELLRHIYQELKPAREHLKRHLPQLEIFLLNVIMANKFCKGFMAISKSSNSYTNKDITYVVTVKVILEGLKKMGWLIEYPGYYDSDFAGMNTRLEVTARFAFWLNTAGLEIYIVKTKPPIRSVTIKDKKKKSIDIPKNLKKQVLEMEEHIAIFNKNLERAHIDLAVSGEDLIEINNRMKRKSLEDQTRESYCFTANKYLKRTFNNGTLEDGGRFYDGWWITLPKEWRKYITINAKKTIELDYSGMHLQLLCAKEGIALSGDPYHINGIDEQFRSVTKLIFFIVFNVTSRESALKVIKANKKISSIRNGKLPKGVKNLDEYLSRIEAAYEGILKYFYSSKGVKLQAIDSRIINNVMLAMSEKYNAVTLPIHDSIIAEFKYRSELKECMLDEFWKAVQGHCDVKEKPFAEYGYERIENLNEDYITRAKQSGLDYKSLLEEDISTQKL
jgi:hypothetical protein